MIRTCTETSLFRASVRNGLTFPLLGKLGTRGSRGIRRVSLQVWVTWAEAAGESSSYLELHVLRIPDLSPNKDKIQGRYKELGYVVSGLKKWEWMGQAQLRRPKFNSPICPWRFMMSAINLSFLNLCFLSCTIGMIVVTLSTFQDG